MRALLPLLLVGLALLGAAPTASAHPCDGSEPCDLTPICPGTPNPLKEPVAYAKWAYACVRDP